MSVRRRATPHGGDYLASLLVGASRELERAGANPPDMAARIEYATVPDRRSTTPQGRLAGLDTRTPPTLSHEGEQPR
jgi:hypothetical protein